MKNKAKSMNHHLNYGIGIILKELKGITDNLNTKFTRIGLGVVLSFSAVGLAHAGLTDVVDTPNTINVGIKKSLTEQIGAGRGDVMTPDSSIFIIQRDPARAIRRGRQLFQRKFKRSQGHGPLINDGFDNIDTNGALGAGLVDSCSGCHGRPKGSAGHGGEVGTRPDSRDAPHLFGLGLVEMLGDEMTVELRAIRNVAITKADSHNRQIRKALKTKGVSFGYITAYPDGSLDNSEIEGVDDDLRVKAFFAEGSTFSMRDFAAGAFNAEMGLQAGDPDLQLASEGNDVVTPSGLMLSGSIDNIPAPPVPDDITDGDGDGVFNEIDTAVLDYMEFYLLNYFRPATYKQTRTTKRGKQLFKRVGCADCHIPDLVIKNDRRVADVETKYDEVNGGFFNNLFATASTKFDVIDDNSGFPELKLPQGNSFVVEGLYSDLKRHDLGPAFHERNFDGTTQKEFVTEPLWGVGTTAPYGHDGRTINLTEVINRHWGEATYSRKKFMKLRDRKKNALLAFLRSLVLFPPDDTASNLNPDIPETPGFPQVGHGNIKLPVLFNDPGDLE